MYTMMLEAWATALQAAHRAWYSRWCSLVPLLVDMGEFHCAVCVAPELNQVAMHPSWGLAKH